MEDCPPAELGRECEGSARPAEQKEKAETDEPVETASKDANKCKDTETAEAVETASEDAKTNGRDSSTDNSGLEDDDRELIAENVSRLKRSHADVDSEEELERMFDNDNDASPAAASSGGLASPSKTTRKDDDMADFIEEDDEEEETGHGKAKPAPRKRPAASAAWFDRSLSQDTLHDLMDVFGDGSEYVELVLRGLRQQQRKTAASPASSQDKPEQLGSKADWPDRLHAVEDTASPSNGVRWVQRQVAALFPGVDVASTVQDVLGLLHAGMDIPVISLHHREAYYPRDLSMDHLWAIADADRGWQRMARKRRQADSIARAVARDLPQNIAAFLQLPRLRQLIDASEDEETLDLSLSYLGEVAAACSTRRPCKSAFGKTLRCGNPVLAICPFAFGAAVERGAAEEQPAPDVEDVEFHAQHLAMHPASAAAIRRLFRPHALLSTRPVSSISTRHELGPVAFLSRKPAGEFREDDALALKSPLLHVAVDYASAGALYSVCIRHCSEDVVRRAVEGILLPRISAEVVAAAVRAAEEWGARYAQHVLQERAMVAGRDRFAVFSVGAPSGPDETLPVVVADESGRVDAMTLSHREALDELAALSKDRAVLLAGRHPVLYDLFLDADDAGLSFAVDDTCDMSLSLVEYARTVADRQRSPLLHYAALSDEALLRVDLGLSSALPKELLLKHLHRAITSVLSMEGAVFHDSRRCLRHISGYVDCAAASREELALALGPVRFANCAPFLMFPDSAEPLDAFRIHPRDYPLARKIAADALEMEFAVETDVAAGREAIRRVRGAHAQLDALLLDEFAAQLGRSAGTERALLPTLLSIRDELKRGPLGSLLSAPAAPPMADVCRMLCGREALVPGQVVQVRAVRGRPYDGVLLPSSLQCIVHGGSVPAGDFAAVLTRLVPEKMVAHVDVGCGLEDPETPIYGPCDAYFDHEQSAKSARKRKPAAVQQPAAKTSTLMDAVARHPSFRVMSKGEAERTLALKPPGQYILRPSNSLGASHVAVTWKLEAGLHLHLDLQVGRTLSLNRTSSGGSEQFSSVEEFLSAFLEPMNSLLADVRACPKYMLPGGATPEDCDDEIEARLRTQLSAQPARIPYCVTLSRRHPGQAQLCFIGGSNGAFHAETIAVSAAATGGGLKMRGHVFERVEPLIAWFKTHYGGSRRQQ